MAISTRCNAPRATRARAEISFILDPILDPIHFGFAASIARYVELRAREPEAEIMMGTGNLTELTDADSSGVTAAMLGLCSELEHPSSAHGAGVPTYAPHAAGARRRAAHDVRGARRSRSAKGL